MNKRFMCQLRQNTGFVELQIGYLFVLIYLMAKYSVDTIWCMKHEYRFNCLNIVFVLGEVLVPHLY